MKPPVIAIEGADKALVQLQVDMLESTLFKAGIKAAIFRFPNVQKNSSYFVKEYYARSYGSNPNPYAVTSFYALDRFDAQSDINEAISKNEIIILSNYIGSTLAEQGSRFNSSQQKDYFNWADNFEAQVYGNVRPSLSFILNNQNKEDDLAKTYKILSKHFPKDYSFVELKNPHDNAIVDAIISSVSKPKKVHESSHKDNYVKARAKYKINTCSLLDLLRSPIDVSDIKISKDHIDIPGLNRNQSAVYREGIEDLNHIRNQVLKETQDNKKTYVSEFLSVLSSVVSYKGSKIKNTITKEGSFENVLHEAISLSYSSGIKTGAEITNVIPRNQMTIVNDILFAVTDLSQEQIFEQANKISYEKKTELIRAYIKDSHGTGLNNVNYTFNLGASLHDILWLKRYLQKETITIQNPSPRNGYDIPKFAEKQSSLYEEYFDNLIELNSRLSNTEANMYLVALGNIASAKLKLSYHELKKLKDAKNAPQIAHDIVVAASLTHPILYE